MSNPFVPRQSPPQGRVPGGTDVRQLLSAVVVRVAPGQAAGPGVGLAVTRWTGGTERRFARGGVRRGTENHPRGYPAPLQPRRLSVVLASGRGLGREPLFTGVMRWEGSCTWATWPTT